MSMRFRWCSILLFLIFFLMTTGIMLYNWGWVKMLKCRKYYALCNLVSVQVIIYTNSYILFIIFASWKCLWISHVLWNLHAFASLLLNPILIFLLVFPLRFKKFFNVHLRYQPHLKFPLTSTDINFSISLNFSWILKIFLSQNLYWSWFRSLVSLPYLVLKSKDHSNI